MSGGQPAPAPIIPPDRQVVQGYEAGTFTVSGTRHEGSILIFPERVEPWTVIGLDQLVPGCLEAVTSYEPPIELLLIGTGGDFALCPPDLADWLKQRGVAVEAMATPAACRTYNVLLAEGRRVAAALLALPAVEK